MTWKPQVFAIGDHVLMRHENKLSLEYNWKGPYRVINKNAASHIYQLQDLNGNTYNYWVHTDRLRPINFSTEPTTPWYDPTTSRAAERRHLEALSQLHVLEDDKHSGEGVLSQHYARQTILPNSATLSFYDNHAKPINTATLPSPAL